MKRKILEFERIGYIDIDFELYKQWFYSEKNKPFVEKIWKEYGYSLHTEIEDIYNMCENYINSFNHPDEEDELCYQRTYILSLKKHLNYCKEYNQRISYVYETDAFYIIRFGKSGFIIPKIANECFKVSKLNNYDDYSLSSLKTLKSGSGEVSGVERNLPSDITKSSLKSKQEALKEKISDIEKQCADIKEGKAEEVKDLAEQIEKMKAELEAKKQSMINLMQSKMTELEETKKKMEQQIYQLDAEIYSIRCFFGEVIDFTKIRSGKSANIDEPVVLYQKLRYLDEEIGKIVNFYNIEANELSIFEKLIAARDDVFNTFLPTKKAIALVRLSKDGKRFTYSEVYHNMLDNYELEHANTIGILIRDNENLYIGWTDDKRINIKEDMFYTPGERVISSYNDEDNKEIIDRETQDSDVKAMVSRYFIFSILSGILSGNYKTNMINIPKNVNLLVPNEYVIYSTMDGWIEDNRFGTAADIINKCNTSFNLGDSIISCQSLYPCRGDLGRYQTYNNDRGIGEKNRTSDVAVKDKEVYSINLINYEGTVITFTRKPTAEEISCEPGKSFYNGYTIKHREPDEIIQGRWCLSQKDTLENWRAKINDFNTRLWHFEFIDEPKIDKIQTHYFVSLIKGCSNDYVYNNGRYTERKREARANFEVFTSEMINIEIMNTEWIKYLLTTKKIGNVRIGGEAINYNYFIPYLSKMMDAIKVREANEYDTISKYVDLSKIPDWNVKLSEWKVQTGHHKIGERYAKQFAKNALCS